MKKTAFLFIILLALTGCNSKPTFDASLLIGKWVTTIVDYEEGIRMQTQFTLNFENEKEVNFEAKYNIEGEYVGSLTGKGKYTINGDKINMNMPESNIDFQLNRSFFDSTAEYKMAMKEAKNEMMKEFDLGGEIKVISISPSKLILEEDEGTFEYKRRN